jgi:hypothetical protein
MEGPFNKMLQLGLDVLKLRYGASGEDRLPARWPRGPVLLKILCVPMVSFGFGPLKTAKFLSLRQFPLPDRVPVLGRSPLREGAGSARAGARCGAPSLPLQSAAQSERRAGPSLTSA